MCDSLWQRVVHDVSLTVHCAFAVRADEANHRDVNHTFASLELDQDVPFAEDGRFVHQPGEHETHQQYAASAGHAK